MKPRSYLSLLFCLLIYITTNAQVGFQQRDLVDPSISAGSVESVYAADLDNDGDIDILSASRFDDKIAWYPNASGQGLFPEQIIISTNADQASSVHAADLDGDGDLDVLSASEGDNKVAWYENLDGLGNFGPQQIISTNAESATTVYAADLDGDGNMDVISGSKQDDKVAWYKNTNGLGNFVEQTPITLFANQVQSVHAADLDGDGDMDVLSASPNDFDLTWYENLDGQGSFSIGTNLESISDEPEFVYAADMDNDGDQDILSASPGSNRVAWYINLDGQGNFSNRQTIGIAVDPESVFPVDIDNDGDLDVVASGGNFVNLYRNMDGLGDFGDAETIASNVDLVRFVFAADLDGDEDSDVIVASTGQDRIIVYPNEDGQGSFSEQQLITFTIKNVTSFDLTDMDGDSDLDLVAASPDNGRIAWYENTDGQGSYDIYHVAAQALDYPRYAIAEDFDGDGDMDILSASAVEDKLFWFENLNGLGEFGPEQIITTEINTVNYLTTADLDGDGDIDLLSTAFDDAIAWYENLDGSGEFAAAQVISNEFTLPRFLSTGDLDDDGDLDLISLSLHDRLLFWFENLDGQGSFGPAMILWEEVLGMERAFPSDVDGDGDLDILAHTSTFPSPSQIVWFENLDGQANFGAAKLITSFTERRIDNLFFADLDNDDDIDIFYSRVENFVEHLDYIEHLDGAGHFSAQKNILTNGAAGGPIQIGDIDGDGDTDIFSGSESFARLYWYENIGIVGNQFRGVVRLDLDANGCDDQDIRLENVLVQADNGINQFATLSQENGSYQMAVTVGDYTSQIIAPINFTANPVSYTDNFPELGNTAINNYCLTPNEIFNDLSISLFPLDDARPGFDASYEIIYKNIGTTVLSGEISFEYNAGKLSLLASSSPIANQTSNIISFEFNDINPFETRTISLDFNVLAPPTVNIDEVLTFSAAISTAENDNNEEDNLFKLDQTVVGSYDPNDIRVLEGSEILLADVDKYLHYIIRFQNTGTAEAINVRVDNILDDRLDWNSFELEETSHPNRVEIIDGNEISFIFDNIFLPDSTSNEPASHGYIAYRIKPNAEIGVGEIINNKADIFFDFNPPIITNTVSTEVINPNSTVENSPFEFSIYPIPASDVLHIESQEIIKRIAIYDSLGRLVLAKDNDHSIDISGLSAGVYFCDIFNLQGEIGQIKILVN